MCRAGPRDARPSRDARTSRTAVRVAVLPVHSFGLCYTVVPTLLHDRAFFYASSVGSRASPDLSSSLKSLLRSPSKPKNFS